MLELYPDNLNAAVLQGKLYIKRNEFKNAIDCYKNIISMSNKFYPLFLDIANAYLECGDKENAQKYYEKAIEYVPDMTPAYVNYAKLLCELGDTKAALRKIKLLYQFSY